MASNAASATAEVDDVEAMMRELGLTEEDLDDVIFDEKQAPAEGPRWIMLARVNTTKTYSQTWFYRNMRSAWDAAQEVKFKPLEENLYTVQFSCLGDWERVINDGPWNFRGDAVVMARYDGISKPSTVKLETIDIWIQIHDLPDLYAHLITPLAAKVGEVLFTEPLSHDFIGNFYRVWVRINVSKPLKNAVSMVREGKRQIYRVKYEKLPDWCAVCGRLGHLYKEHGNGIHPPSALVFKDLRASWVMRTGRGPGGGRGNRGGRRGGRSGGRNNTRYEEGNTSYAGTKNMGRTGTAAAPGAEDVDMEDATRKRLAAGLLERTQNDTAGQGRTTADNNLALVPVGSSVASPPPTRELKRSKTFEEGNEGSNSAVKNLAGSFEERRRAQ